MKRLLFWVLPVIALGGCASQDTGTEPSLLKRVAQAIVGGAAYDRAVVAARDGDDAAFLRAQREIERAGGEFSAPGAQSLAGQAVKMAINYGQKAQTASGAEAQMWRQKEAEQYRRALRLGAAHSNDAQMLNSVGYFLAERGSSESDFKQAEEMTRKALKLSQTKVDGAKIDAARSWYQFDMANTRDSLAWALYRQKRFDEAAREQERAVKEAREAVSQAGILGEVWAKMPPELPYHLGEIYRAQGKIQPAREQWQAALKLDPQFQAALSALQKLDGKMPNAPTPDAEIPDAETPDLVIPDVNSDRLDL